MEIVKTILLILGALGIFLLGIKLMMEGMQRTAGPNWRKYINQITHNKRSAVLSGIVATSVIQSSSAFTLLIITLVEAGLVNLKKAFGLIIGTNIGTTVTLWLVILGLKWDIKYFAFLILVIAIPFYVTNRLKQKYMAQFFIGFALIFIALFFYDYTSPELRSLSWISDLKESFTHFSFGYALLFILIGLVGTFVIQSSSASTMLIAFFVGDGLPIELGLLMILGANIGTTLTAHLGSLVGNYKTKIVSWYHTLFNIFGTLLFIWFVPIFHETISIHAPKVDNLTELAIFHTAFNVLTSIIVLPLSPYILQKVSSIIENKIKDKKSGNSYALYPEILLHDFRKDIRIIIGYNKQINAYLGRLITESDPEKFKDLIKRINDLEKQCDGVRNQSFNRLIDMNEQEMLTADSHKIYVFLYLINALENISDLASKTAKIHEIRRAEASFITPKLRSYLLEMQDLLTSAFTNFVQSYSMWPKQINLKESYRIEGEMDELYKKGEEAMTKTTEKEKISISSAFYYKELLQNYEIIGDLIHKCNQTLESIKK